VISTKLYFRLNIPQFNLLLNWKIDKDNNYNVYMMIFNQIYKFYHILENKSWKEKKIFLVQKKRKKVRPIIHPGNSQKSKKL
jgi:hypothetical protein